MRSFIYVFITCYVSLFLFTTVHRFEPNRLLATVLKLLLVGLTAAAIVNEFTPLSACTFVVRAGFACPW